MAQTWGCGVYKRAWEMVLRAVKTSYQRSTKKNPSRLPIPPIRTGHRVGGTEWTSHSGIARERKVKLEPGLVRVWNG